jgi:hypothetical protein
MAGFTKLPKSTHRFTPSVPGSSTARPWSVPTKSSPPATATPAIFASAPSPAARSARWVNDHAPAASRTPFTTRFQLAPAKL